MCIQRFTEHRSKYSRNKVHEYFIYNDVWLTRHIHHISDHAYRERDDTPSNLLFFVLLSFEQEYFYKTLTINIKYLRYITLSKFIYIYNNLI
jgi:hypothetical protein